MISSIQRVGWVCELGVAVGRERQVEDYRKHRQKGGKLEQKEQGENRKKKENEMGADSPFGYKLFYWL